MHKRQRGRHNLLLMTAVVSPISIGSQALAATTEDLNHDATQALQRLPFAPQARAHAGLLVLEVPARRDQQAFSR